MTDQQSVESEQRDESNDDATGGLSEDEELDVLDVRERVSKIAESLLGQPFDGITSVERAEGGGWRALFEVVERSAVPDTQDIIGRYELHLSRTGTVKEYSLQQRFKRSELQGKAL
jgi:Gas vesicle synthesis protein GvpO.